VYFISVAARLVAVHPQTLRTYERLGLINPGRAASGVRLYSDRDIERLRQIQRLTQELGVNLAGVEIILNLLEDLEKLREENENLRNQLVHGPKALNPAPRREIEIRVDEG
jgi:MerR family transcriptional regulator/heat shock protein HspR